jgi:hypothetical protein
MDIIVWLVRLLLGSIALYDQSLKSGTQRARLKQNSCSQPLVMGIAIFLALVLMLVIVQL